MFFKSSPRLFWINTPPGPVAVNRSLSVVFLILAFCLAGYSQAFSQAVSVTDSMQEYTISANMDELVDGTGALTAGKVLHDTRFHNTNGRIPIFPNNVNSVWFRFTAQNQSTSSTVFLNIAYPNLSRVRLYRVDSGRTVLAGEQGNEFVNNQAYPGSPNLIFDLSTPPGSSQEYLLHVYSRHPIMVPAKLLTDKALQKSINLQNIIISVYLGVLMVMFLYNFFLFFATRDRSYLYYVVYIFFLALAQTTLAGYGYRYIWPNHPAFNTSAVVLSSSGSAMTGLLFSMHFLRTATKAPGAHKWMWLLILIFAAGIVSSFLSGLNFSYQVLNYNSLLGVLSVLGTSLYMAKKRYRPAYFYLTAWLLFLVSFIILILRNLAILPYNNLTTYTIYIGSALEVALLSIALADKINVLRKEKEQSQAESLRRLEINEKLVRDQNVMLEKKVAERTEELQSSNSNLSTALQNLKDTQIQLVEAEKMASLGQLTAGIAHEINNPINFVKSNIKPLQLDINDLIEVIDEYDKLHTVDGAEIPEKLNHIQKLKKQIDIDYVKTEIDSLVKGIREGAERTAEIVMGLRTFSRLDESEVKTVNIHEGIESTLVLLKNQLPSNIKVEKYFEAQGNIECFPGKLNQVFMNILSNGIQAIKEKEDQSETERVVVRTKDIGNRIQISIKDSGAGMTDEVRQKIFDPFFTTKDVGEGTGLGLSIVYKIIQKHGGKIEVVSSKGNGAEFVITLFHSLPESAID